MSVRLFLDTTDSNTARVVLECEGKRFEKAAQSPNMKSQMVLPLIEALLQENNLKLTDITEIAVHPGPGSFTGLRVGVSVANALSVLLGIPVNGSHTLAIPAYPT